MLISNSIMFPNTRMTEDEVFAQMAWYCAESSMTFEKILYCYFMNSESATGLFNHDYRGIFNETYKSVLYLKNWYAGGGESYDEMSWLVSTLQEELPIMCATLTMQDVERYLKEDRIQNVLSSYHYCTTEQAKKMFIAFLRNSRRAYWSTKIKNLMKYQLKKIVQSNEEICRTFNYVNFYLIRKWEKNTQ